MTQPQTQNRADRLSYTIAQFCEATGTTRSATYKAIAEGALQTFKIGRRRMVSARAAQDYIGKLEAASTVNHA